MTSKLQKEKTEMTSKLQNEKTEMAAKRENFVSKSELLRISPNISYVGSAIGLAPGPSPGKT